VFAAREIKEPFDSCHILLVASAMERKEPRVHERMTVPVQIFAAVAMAVVLAAGIFAFGRAADEMNVAMGLTAVWFGAVFLAGALLVWRRRALLVPLAVGFGAVAVAAFVLVVLPTLRDKTVNEGVVTGAPAGEAAPGGGGGAAGNVEFARGSFQEVAHAGRGTATVVELADGGRVLTLTDFETDSGPDLRLYVSTGNPAGGGDLGDFEDLGGLKGNKGNQQYELPDGLDLDRFSNVVVWCRAFSVGFTSAPLERQ
jgi:hypothetical protein